VFEKEIPSHLELITVLVVRAVDHLLREELIEFGFREKAQLVFTEALRNAVGHGNRGDFQRKATLRIYASDQRWGAIIEDEGEGFDVEQRFSSSVEDGLWGQSGRGLRILGHCMDVVTFFDGGRSVLLERQRPGGGMESARTDGSDAS